MTVNDDIASANADRAAQRHGQEELTESVGEGLAAVAYAVLDLAAAVRELANAHRGD
ncbi:hypothetical protein [Krasilnikovia sp. MM14-A1259]|uniref:hypothetical protein n=1 Tax=Krasilnikovia sp. MM14-A1259 TaxID=3373539 RepID=UPI00399C7602